MSGEAMSVLLVLFLDFMLSLVFLLPLKDERGPEKHVPMMTLTLIVINVVVHVVFHYLAPTWVGDVELWSEIRLVFLLIPAAVLRGIGLGATSMITSAFLHADWSHLLGNMFFLFFFGRKVEDLLGSWKFALFYLVCIFVSGIGSVLGRATLPITQGMIPGLGASGAVTGVMAAYLFLYSEQRIRTLTMIIIPIPFTVKIPAWVFIVYTVLRDMLSGWLEQEFQARGYLYSMIDSFAHLGGVMAGMMCLYLFLPAQVLYYRYQLSKRHSPAYRKTST
jgi:membrane associated rhomboid family serine protease